MRRKFKYTFTRKEETEGGFSSLVFAGCSLILFLVSACLSFFWGRESRKLDRSAWSDGGTFFSQRLFDRNEEL